MSKTLNESTKDKIWPILNVDYMSLDESEVNVAATQTEDSSNSENETTLVKKNDFLDTGFPGDHKNCKSLLKAYIIDRKFE